MAAVHLGAAELQPWLADGVEIAAVNAPDVVRGVRAQGSDRIPARAARGCRCRRARACTRRTLSIRAMMAPALAPFTAVLERVTLLPPTRPYVSNLSGTWITPQQATSPAYYAEHLRRAVQFEAGMRTLAADADAALRRGRPGHRIDVVGAAQSRGRRRAPRGGVDAPPQRRACRPRGTARRRRPAVAGRRHDHVAGRARRAAAARAAADLSVRAQAPRGRADGGRGGTRRRSRCGAPLVAPGRLVLRPHLDARRQRRRLRRRPVAGARRWRCTHPRRVRGPVGPRRAGRGGGRTRSGLCACRSVAVARAARALGRRPGAAAARHAARPETPPCREPVEPARRTGRASRRIGPL